MKRHLTPKRAYDLTRECVARWLTTGPRNEAGELYIIPQVRVTEHGRARLVNTGWALKEAGAQPVPGKLNMWLPPQEGTS